MSHQGGASGEEPEQSGGSTPDAAPSKVKPDVGTADPPHSEPPDAGGASPDAGAPPPDAKVPVDTAPPADTGPAPVTFTELWMAILGTPMTQAGSCAGPVCHNPGTKDNLNFASKMTAYTTLTRNNGPVIKGNPNTSKLITRLTTTDAKMRMPLGKPALSKELIDKVRAWIAAGANND